MAFPRFVLASCLPLCLPVPNRILHRQGYRPRCQRRGGTCFAGRLEQKQGHFQDDGRNGTFEFHPRISTPTRVYLYATVPEDVYANPYDGGQLKDFFLEPGTIVVDVHADDEHDMTTGATGTVLNDAYRTIQAADVDARDALWEEAVRDERTNLLALVYADRHSDDLDKASEILDRLSPDLAKTYKKTRPFVPGLGQEL